MLDSSVEPDVELIIEVGSFVTFPEIKIELDVLPELGSRCGAVRSCFICEGKFSDHIWIVSFKSVS